MGVSPNAFSWFSAQPAPLLPTTGEKQFFWFVDLKHFLPLASGITHAPRFLPDSLATLSKSFHEYSFVSKFLNIAALQDSVLRPHLISPYSHSLRDLILYHDVKHYLMFQGTQIYKSTSNYSLVIQAEIQEVIDISKWMWLKDGYRFWPHITIHPFLRSVT